VKLGLKNTKSSFEGMTWEPDDCLGFDFLDPTYRKMDFNLFTVTKMQ
jgi:hypothetical protein